MTSSASSSDSGILVVATHRKARRDYHVLETIEAGISLMGTEVKSVRQGHMNLTEGYAIADKKGAIFLHGVHINPYDHGNVHNHDPDRERRLLLHRREIDRLFGQTAIKGHSLIPLRAYFKRGRLKVELGVCKGKQTIDKREDIKLRTANREMERAMSSRRAR